MHREPRLGNTSDHAPKSTAGPGSLLDNSPRGGSRCPHLREFGFATTRGASSSHRRSWNETRFGPLRRFRRNRTLRSSHIEAHKMSPAPKWRRLIPWATGSIVGELFGQAFWSTVATVLTVTVGWFQGAPIFHLMVGGTLMFAAVMTGLLRVDEWKERNRTDYKLRFVNMRIHVTADGNQIKAIRLGFHVQNAASFPMAFNIDELTTSLIGENPKIELYPPSKPYQKREIEVNPGAIGYFDDYDIVVPEEIKRTLTGRIQCRVSYGRIGSLNRSLEIKKRTSFVVHDGGLSGGQQWYDE